jgi:hypothetical protein
MLTAQSDVLQFHAIQGVYITDFSFPHMG